jgi:hypothetical protein
MPTIDVNEQLDCIRAIQTELRETLLTEDAPGIETMLAEKRARLDGVLALRKDGLLDSAEVQVRLLEILNTDIELQGLISKQLTVLSVAIRKAREAQRLVSGYGAAARVEAVAPASGVTV